LFIRTLFMGVLALLRWFLLVNHKFFGASCQSSSVIRFSRDIGLAPAARPTIFRLRQLQPLAGDQSWRAFRIPRQNRITAPCKIKTKIFIQRTFLEINLFAGSGEAKLKSLPKKG